MLAEERGAIFRVSIIHQCFIDVALNSSLVDKLKESKFADEVEHMTSVFDKSAKLSFRNPASPAFIRFGTSKDKDLTVGIRSGQMKIAG